ncbi:hypothetical protein BGZ61DRAFT_177161 [Ilyonectria robusta]|uniref:uncharacterized protein n=1 Tax=Ilyonectria robusta TaxID=1079257 RepID=UPI001E8D5F9B|nr:uncharacterized protein BGZ61DRAFT_177161 [Ilyonectria robusta]KAH8656745.1 hypothetical protein BGZ61DRAFT_177161 [Ilyonectria robusta]
MLSLTWCPVPPRRIYDIPFTVAWALVAIIDHSCVFGCSFQNCSYCARAAKFLILFIAMPSTFALLTVRAVPLLLWASISLEAPYPPPISEAGWTDKSLPNSVLSCSDAKIQ